MSELTTGQMEDDLFIYSWGLYVRPRIGRELGYKPAEWQRLYRAGFQESPNPPPIDPDREEITERMVLRLPKDMQEILVSLYSFRLGVNQIARESPHSRQEVAKLRDSALSILWGSLKFQDAV